jgi:hypothetical protein
MKQRSEVRGQKSEVRSEGSVRKRGAYLFYGLSSTGIFVYTTYSRYASDQPFRPMMIIQEITVADDVADRQFACDLAQCKGACCTMPGAMGAPLLESEIVEIHKASPYIRKYLSPEHLDAIERSGLFKSQFGAYVTPCVNDGACVFVTYEGDVAKCSFEKAYIAGEIEWRKPISCHLFPLRVDRGVRKHLRYESIPECTPALARGNREAIFLSDFLKDSLSREFGTEWYNEFTQQCTDARETVEASDG